MSARGAAPSNEHIVQLLDAVRADLAELRKQQDRIGRDVPATAREEDGVMPSRGGGGARTP